jgi:hypothetical protein
VDEDVSLFFKNKKAFSKLERAFLCSQLRGISFVSRPENVKNWNINCGIYAKSPKVNGV